MDRRRHAILNLLGTISLAFCILSTLLWAYTWFDRSMFLATCGRLYGVSANGGGCFAVWRYDILPANLPLQFIAGPLDNAIVRRATAGGGGSQIVLNDNYKLLEIPLVPLIPLFGAGPLILATISRRERRRIERLMRVKGLCPNCAYNLTGNTSGICPECGTRWGHLGRRRPLKIFLKK